MAQSYWHSPIAVMSGDGSAVTGTGAGSLLLASAKPLIVANTLQLPSRLNIKGAGRISNIVTTPGTLTLTLLYGATTIFSSGAMQLSTTVHTTLPFDFDIQLTMRALGATANAMGQGKMSSQCLSLTAVADSTTTVATLMMPNTTPAVGSNFDHTASALLDLQAQFSLTGNSITLHQCEFWLSN